MKVTVILLTITCMVALLRIYMLKQDYAALNHAFRHLFLQYRETLNEYMDMQDELNEKIDELSKALGIKEFAKEKLSSPLCEAYIYDDEKREWITREE